MERVDYVKLEKPKCEIATRLHNIIYLGGCEVVAKWAALYADYDAKWAALYADYNAKRTPLDAEIMTYIKTKIPDCAWNGKTLVL